MVKVTYSWDGINPVLISRSVCAVLSYGQIGTGQVRVLSIDRLLCGMWRSVSTYRQLE